MTQAEIKKQIIELLNNTCGLPDTRAGKYRCGTIHRTSLVLATSHHDKPRATPLEFFHEDLTIYIFASPGRKIANIKKNPDVCAAIYQQPMVHTRVQKSLQIFGNAELINISHNPRLFKAKALKWNMYSLTEKALAIQMHGKKLSPTIKKQMAEKILAAMTLIKITPHHIILREYHPDFSMPKYEWKKYDWKA